jgi:hypothetical protein
MLHIDFDSESLSLKLFIPAANTFVLIQVGLCKNMEKLV